MMNPFSLKGKTILVTGASSGIGRSIAIEISRMGGDVILTARNEEKLLETRTLMEPGAHQIVIADLCEANGVSHLVSALPLLDGVVYNAGINSLMPTQFVKAEMMQKILQTNLEAPILLQKALMRAKRQKDGASVVFISSCASLRPGKGNAVYSAAKSGIAAYAKVLALEVAPHDIRVNCVHPAMIWTDMLSLPKENYLQDEQKYPLRRYGRPEEVAYMVVFLLSDATQWVTGTSMVIDGGSLLG